MPPQLEATIAILDEGHTAHASAVEWFRQHGTDGWATCPMTENAVDVVFIGSCTNGRLSDLEQAASVLRGNKVADGVRMLVVPGSQKVKEDAEAQGLDKVFAQAGAEWRESGSHTSPP